MLSQPKKLTAPLKNRLFVCGPPSIKMISRPSVRTLQLKIKRIREPPSTLDSPETRSLRRIFLLPCQTLSSGKQAPFCWPTVKMCRHTTKTPPSNHRDNPNHQWHNTMKNRWPRWAYRNSRKCLRLSSAKLKLQGIQLVGNHQRQRGPKTVEVWVPWEPCK